MPKAAPHAYASAILGAALDTALLEACERGDVAALRAALDAGADAHAAPARAEPSRGMARWRAMELACEGRHPACAEVLAPLGSDDDFNSEGPLSQILAIQAREGYRECRLAIHRGLDAKLPEPDQRLLDAASRGDFEGAARAAADGADLNARSSLRGYDALMLAAYYDHAECAQALLRSGLGDPSRALDWGGNALAVALASDYFRQANEELAEILAPVSDCRSPRVGPGDTLLSQCAQGGLLRAVTALLPGSDADAVDARGHTAIVAATTYAHNYMRDAERIVDLLWGATDLTARNPQGVTVLDQLLASGMGDYARSKLAQAEAARIAEAAPEPAASRAAPRI